jgi:hypothetical protein
MMCFAALDVTYRAARLPTAANLSAWRDSARGAAAQRAVAGRRLWGSIAQFALLLSCPLLRSLNTPEAARGSPTIVFTPLQRRPRTKRRGELRLGGAPIQFRRLLFRSTNSRVFRLIFIVLEIDQPAVRDRGDVRRGLRGHSCLAGCRPPHRNKPVILTVRPHNDLAGERGRRNGHQSGSRGCDER